MLDQHIWARKEAATTKPKRSRHPIAEKESRKWLDALHETVTNVAVRTWQDATERIGCSCVRPGIEQFHKILKSGCTVEDCRLEDAERLKPYLTLMSVVAWRLFWLTHIKGQSPDEPCTAILADHEWKALYTTICRTTSIPECVPSVR